jgi:hemolysin III
VAFVVALVLGGVMIGVSPDAGARIAVIIYVVGLCTMLGVSALYHRLNWSPSALLLMRKLDHSTIFLAIAGTYTPIAALVLDGWHRTAMLAIVWGGTAVGMALQWMPIEAPRWAFTAVYAIVGWSALIAFPQLYEGLGLTGFLLMLGGGVAYTLGAVVYALKKPDPWPLVFGYHEVFHLLTVIGAGLHLACVGLVVLPHAGG